MKKLLVILIILIAPQAKAQMLNFWGHTRARCKSDVAKAHPANKVKLAAGNNNDTLYFGKNKICVLYYKNDICNSQKFTESWYRFYDFKKMMKDSSYRMVNQNVWINPAGTIRYDIASIKNNRYSIQVTKLN